MRGRAENDRRPEVCTCAHLRVQLSAEFYRVAGAGFLCTRARLSFPNMARECCYCCRPVVVRVAVVAVVAEQNEGHARMLDCVLYARSVHSWEWRVAGSCLGRPGVAQLNNWS